MPCNSLRWSGRRDLKLLPPSTVYCQVVLSAVISKGLAGHALPSSCTQKWVFPSRMVPIWSQAKIEHHLA